jgi:hypothetical protein
MPPGLWRTAAPQCGVSGCDKLLQLVQTLHRICIHPRPLRQSGNQGTAGSCNRCRGKSRDPSSTSGSRSFKATQFQYRAASITLSIQTGIRLFFNASRIRRRSSTDHRSCSFSKPAGLSCIFQRRCNHTRIPPLRACWMALDSSRTGNIRVASDQALSGRFGGRAP